MRVKTTKNKTSNIKLVRKNGKLYVIKKKR